MITKTEGITLRVYPLRTTSHVTLWLTREGFRTAVLVKGAVAPRSRYMGQYDLGYTCELLYYTRSYGGLHQIRECTPLSTRTYLRHDWAAMACASYACHLVSLVLPDGARMPALYPLLHAYLDALCDRPDTLGVYRFELDLLHHLGFGPRFNACGRCGLTLEAAGDTTLFSAATGGLICPRCAPHIGTPLHPVASAVLQFLGSPARIAVPDLSLMEEFQTARVLGHFLDWHLDLASRCRAVTLRLLRQRASRASDAGADEEGQ